MTYLKREFYEIRVKSFLILLHPKVTMVAAKSLTKNPFGTRMARKPWKEHKKTLKIRPSVNSVYKKQLFLALLQPCSSSISFLTNKTSVL
jgi:hypothetical protein